MRKLKIPLGTIVAIALFISFQLLTILNAQGAMVLWNKLGSDYEVQNSEVGPDGVVEGGSFMPGVFGNAYVATYDEDRLLSFPTLPLPYPAGAIEFWAKLIDFPKGTSAGGRYPDFAVAKATNYSMLGFTGNDGHGGGGLTARIHGLDTATGRFGYWTYEEILGANHVEDWHHYALVWDVAGIPDIGGKKVAIYLNNQLNSGYWRQTSPWEYDPGIYLLEQQGAAGGWGSVAIDNIKVWDFAKTDYSDRFNEIPIPTTLMLLGTGLAGLIMVRRRSKR